MTEPTKEELDRDQLIISEAVDTLLFDFLEHHVAEGMDRASAAVAVARSLITNAAMIAAMTGAPSIARRVLILDFEEAYSKALPEHGDRKAPQEVE